MAGHLPLRLSFEVDVEALIGAARDAGTAILAVYAQDGQWEVEQKADNSPLTRADREANSLICGVWRGVAFHCVWSL